MVNAQFGLLCVMLLKAIKQQETEEHEEVGRGLDVNRRPRCSEDSNAMFENSSLWYGARRPHPYSQNDLRLRATQPPSNSGVPPWQPSPPESIWL
jgi:hypothetical protein